MTDCTIERKLACTRFSVSGDELDFVKKIGEGAISIFFYQKMCPNIVLEWSCTLFSGFRMVFVRNMIVCTCLQSSSRVNWNAHFHVYFMFSYNLELNLVFHLFLSLCSSCRINSKMLDYKKLTKSYLNQVGRYKDRSPNYIL